MKNNWRVALAAQRAAEDAALIALRALEDAEDERAESEMLTADPAEVAYKKAVDLVLRRGSGPKAK